MIRKSKGIGFILDPLIYLRRHGTPSSRSYLRGTDVRGHKVVTDRATKMAKLTIRNWECGIVCSAEKLGFGESWDILRKFMVFDDAVPVLQVGRPWIRDDRFQ